MEREKQSARRGRRQVPEHPVFVKYKQFIARHPNYAGLPEVFTPSGDIRWVAPKPTRLGQARLRWWKERMREGESLRDTAYRIHPTKRKPCHVCGRVLELDYVYPAKGRLRVLAGVLQERGLLNQELSVYISPEGEGWLTHVHDFLVELKRLGGQGALEAFREVFKVPDDVGPSPREVTEYLLGLPISKRHGRLSPGAMSNAPDRLDGFHSYNLCHRHLVDKGRSKRNLSKYGEDRRAYELWVDGDHKLASWVMREFSRRGWSADHIGPISQGFTHRPSGFRPVTPEFQSRRRDRLRARDVRLLLEAEREGEQVASWHVRALWDALKGCAAEYDSRAEALGRAMRQQVHDTLTLLYHLLQEGHKAFLRHLRRDLFRTHLIRIGREGLQLEPGLNPELVERELQEHGEFHRALRVVVGEARLPLRAENKRNAYRAVRKSIEALRKYAEATTESTGSERRLSSLASDEIEAALSPVRSALGQGGREAFSKAEEELRRVVDQLALKKAERLKRDWGCSSGQPNKGVS